MAFRNQRLITTRSDRTATKKVVERTIIAPKDIAETNGSQITKDKLLEIATKMSIMQKEKEDAEREREAELLKQV